MTPARFDRLTIPARFRGRTLKALRLVAVDGLGIREAARKAKVDPAAVSRAVQSLAALDEAVPRP